MSKEVLTFEKYVDNIYEQVFGQIMSDDKTIVICGLAQFEVLYQICRTFDVTTKWSNTRMYKKAMDTYPMVRHIFETKVQKKWLDEIQKFKNDKPSPNEVKHE